MCDDRHKSFIMEVEDMLITSKNSKNKRRFNDEQIKFLETMFEAKSRPELQMKQQLATRLGLQPRQVAIWFQNRSKSKLQRLQQLNQKTCDEEECENKNCMPIREGEIECRKQAIYIMIRCPFTAITMRRESTWRKKTHNL
ncbi:hypothetical protein Leryth_004853 [Lithospermum erythrorhizon]|nr:hypothetical protein Leryth_004853 [Lithospermum erythrorhizon]